VVHRQHQTGLVAGIGHRHTGPHQRSRVHRDRFPADPAGEGDDSVVVQYAPDGLQPDLHLQNAVHQPAGFLCVRVRQPGTQGIVTADGLRHRGLDRVGRRPAPEAQRTHHVVRRGFRSQPAQKPQPALRRCERPAIHRCTGDGTPRGRSSRRDDLAHRAQRHVVLQQRRDAQVHTELGADPRDQLGCLQRLSTEAEKSVFGGVAGVGDRQRPHTGQRIRGQIRGRIGERHRCQQLAYQSPVGLAVRRRRHPVEPPEQTWHEDGRQPVGHPVPQRGLRWRPAGTGVRDERRGGLGPIAFRCSDSDDTRRLHGGMRAQDVLDLPQLHPVPADLDLIVTPAQVDEFAIRCAHGVVAAAVPAPGHTVEIQHREALGRQLRTAVVAGSESAAGHEHLARGPVRYRMPPFGQHDAHSG
jgi:hypothetical protein